MKILVAACLTSDEVIVKNVPLISDFMIMAEIIHNLGGEVKFNDHSVSIGMKNFASEKISLDKAAEIRTSYMFLAPLFGKTRKSGHLNPAAAVLEQDQWIELLVVCEKWALKFNTTVKTDIFTRWRRKD